MAEASDGTTDVLRADVAVLLADGFNVPLSHVLRDANCVSGWQGPNDDLLLWLKGRHGWSVVVALRYLGSLRQALQDTAS